MTGIFGVLDAAGVERRRVEAAARTASFRGEPVVWCEGPFALGHYRKAGGWSSLAVDAGSVVAIDGRVDATLPGTAADGLGRSVGGHALLASVLAEHGGAGLAGLAADFAVARLDRARGVLLLSRDAFALRPLFWSRRGRALAFASDAEVLVALGFASGALDREQVAAYLAGWSVGGARAVFEGVCRLEGGTWLEADLEGRIHTATWFHPEEVDERPCPLGEAAEALRDVLATAVADRARGRATALLLSGGRDSGAVALAGARAGVALTCLTNRYPPGLGCSEEVQAEELASVAGYDCGRVVMPAAPSLEQLVAVPEVSGTPLAPPSFAEAGVTRDAVAANGAEVVLDGDGGDILFASGPVATLDLVRRGSYRQGADVLCSFPRSGRYSSTTVAKVIGRAVCPAWLLGARDRARRPPEWVRFPVKPPVRSDARTSRQELLDGLASYPLNQVSELTDRFLTMAGARHASPMLDQRVVRLALSWPVDLRAPVPGPKPVLAAALLGPLDGSRRKTSFLPYYLATVEVCRSLFAGWVGPGSLSARQGYVDGRAQERDVSRNTTPSLLRCLVLEAWLRRGGTR